MSDTPRTAAVAMALRTEDVGWAACSMMEKHAQGLERELAEAKEANAELVKDNEWQKQYALRWEKAATVAMNEVQEQARLLGISGSREAKLLAELVELDHCRMEAERAEALAKEVAALKDALALIYDRYEEGMGCYEDPEESAGYVGNAVRLSEDEENKIIALIPSDAARGEK